VVNTYLLPPLRGRAIAELATKDASRVLERIAERAPHVASKARQHLGSIVDYAIKHGLREDGKLLSLKGTVPRLAKSHIPAATKAADIGPLVAAIDAYDSPITRAALKLAMYTALRPGVVASAEWSEMDLDAAEWHIPAARMKTRTAHIVSLPTQAIAVLREMQALAGRSRYVFPSPAQQKTPHLHRDALSKALRNMGFQGTHATHGFRGMFRTVGRERLGIDVDVLEAQLAHAKRGDVQKAYDRTTFDDARRDAMQRWADYLDALKAGGDVFPMKRKT
jgi:integrase